jgi:hypothetical protein
VGCDAHVGLAQRRVSSLIDVLGHTALGLLSFRLHLLPSNFDLLSQPVTESSKDEILDVKIKSFARLRVEMLIDLDFEEMVSRIDFVNSTVKDFLSNIISYF